MGQDDGERTERRTLRDELTQRGRLPWEEAVDVVVSIARALSAAHAQSPPALHGDIKPENVVIGDRGEIELIGAAKALDAARARATGAQTVGYMSPEQIDAKPLDARSDLYALGLVLYEALAGRPPFESTSPRELMNQQCAAAPPPLDDDVRASTPRGVEEVLFALLQKAPADRPKSAQEVIERLEPLRPAVRRESASRDDDSPKSAAKAGALARMQDRAVGREMSTERAIALIAVVSIAAALTGYACRMRSTPNAPAPSSSASASTHRP